MDDVWVVEDTRAVAGTPGEDCDASYLVKLSRGEDRAQSMVEFAAPSSVASGGYAQEALRPFLNDSTPPQRVVVEVNGKVRVASTEERTSTPPVQRQPRRAGQAGSGRARKRSRG